MKIKNKRRHCKATHAKFNLSVRHGFGKLFKRIICFVVRGKKQNDVYVFTSLWQTFNFDGKIISVLVPYHFLQTQQNGSSTEHICGVTLKYAYKTSASPEETAAFYKRKNLFDVTVLNDAVYVAADGYTLEAVLKTIDAETFITFNLQ